MLFNQLRHWRKKPVGRVFISYRRSDTQWFAGRLADSLSQYFGDDRVFRDIEDIRGGADFGDVIHGNLAQTDAAIILIGDQWLDATDELGNRRLDAPDDWVGNEIESALVAKIPVYPVLVEGTSMPRVDELPERLQSLSRFNAVALSDACWGADVTRLARIISLDIPSQTERKLTNWSLLISIALTLSLLTSCTLLFANLYCHVSATLPVPVNWLSESLCVEYDVQEMLVANAWPLSLGAASICFMLIAPSSAFLFLSARLIEERHRPWHLAAAWIGACGVLFAFLALAPIPEPYEPMSMLFISIVTVLIMFILMTQSGFRPR